MTTLEFDKVLETLADCAMTEGAKQRALQLIPATNINIVQRLQQQTTDAKALTALKGTPSFGGVKDVSNSVERASKGATLSPKELIDIAVVCRTARVLSDYINVNNKKETALDEIFERLFPNKFLEDKINKTIISEDMIADEASPELSDIRRKMRVMNNRVRENLQKYISSGAYSKYLQENIITMRNGRYVIPVKSEYRNEIKGLVHDTSSSGATLFVEPLNVVETNNEIKVLERAETFEIDRILAELSADTAAFDERMLLNYQNITELALIFAKSELSYRLTANPVKIKEELSVEFIKARHPLLALKDKKGVVPINIAIGGDYKTLVITGPNTGGKTVSLKTLGLLSMMTQAGLHLPVDDASHTTVFREILPDIGDEQSIEQSLSTFSSHMVNIIDIVHAADERSLVLFDELGAGTDPVEGAALAIAILERIRSLGALCAATTHYSELKVYALENEEVMNASCEFDVNTLRPTYKLTMGIPGRSNAFAISEKLGLSESIIERATELVSKENKQFENVIDKLEENRMDMEQQRKQAETLRQDMEKKHRDFEASMGKKLADAEKELEKSRDQAKRMIANARAASEFVYSELEQLKKKKESEDFAKDLSRVREELKLKVSKVEEEIAPINEETLEEEYELPRPLVVGDRVYLVDIGIYGNVTALSDKDDNVAVESGIVKTRTHISKLRLAPKTADVTKRSQYRNVGERAVKSFKTDIDIRGQTGDDAWFMVDRYLDDAVVAGVSSVTLIHGKGTGALKNALWKYMKGDRRIDKFRLGKYGEGDGGVTIVDLAGR